MKKKPTQLSQLAALHALGALEGEEAQAFSALLAENSAAREETQAFGAVTEALALSLPKMEPSADLKARILSAAEKAKARARASRAMARLLPAAQHGMAFLPRAAETGWVRLPVPGAWVRLLAFDPGSPYAVVLGKLEAGSRYPGHTHKHPEDIFMLSGDLHVGDQVLRAGDFHHAEGASQHSVNWSEEGCVLICVLSKEDLLNQLG